MSRDEGWEKKSASAPRSVHGTCVPGRQGGVLDQSRCLWWRLPLSLLPTWLPERPLLPRPPAASHNHAHHHRNAPPAHDRPAARATARRHAWLGAPSPAAAAPGHPAQAPSPSRLQGLQLRPGGRPAAGHRVRLLALPPLPAARRRRGPQAPAPRPPLGPPCSGRCAGPLGRAGWAAASTSRQGRGWGSRGCTEGGGRRRGRQLAPKALPAPLPEQARINSTPMARSGVQDEAFPDSHAVSCVACCVSPLHPWTPRLVAAPDHVFALPTSFKVISHPCGTLPRPAPAPSLK